MVVGLTRALRQMGRQVLLFRPDVERLETWGVLQAVPERRERGRQFVPTELGVVQEERFLYLGEAAVSLAGMEGGFLRCGGVDYTVQSAQAVYLGEVLTHWRAVLRVRDEVEI